MKRIFTLALLSLGAAVFCLPTLSQNIQFHYDFGNSIYRKGEKAIPQRPSITTTVEMFRPDSWGNTFFFIDMDYGHTDGDGGVLGAYWEISREFQFWKAPVTVHVEYNGGLSRTDGSYDDAWLAGPAVNFVSKDFTRSLSFQALYKAIPRNAKSVHNFQLTAVWNILFCRGMFQFSGFADFWKENRPWQVTSRSGADGTDFIFMTEPQIWYNFNTIKGLEKLNLSVGSEVEISSNFVKAGFYAIPTAAVKWTF